MVLPLFINSKIKLAWWFFYTAAIISACVIGALSLLALTASPFAWCVLLAAPLLLSIGYFFQHFLIHKKIIGNKLPFTQENQPDIEENPYPDLAPKQTRINEELDALIRSPHTLNQDSYNLCGPAAILYALTYSNPQALKQFALDFAESPTNVGLSLPTRCDSDEINLPITVLIMMGLKHHLNVTGYHPINETLERIQGASAPKQLMDWITYFNTRLKLSPSATTEAMIIRNGNQKPISYLHRSLLGGVYSKEHVSFDSLTKNFEGLLAKLNSSIILLISVNLCLRILGENNANIHPTLLGIEFSHYVYLNELGYNQLDETVAITISTWGVCATNKIPWEIFSEGYCGFIAWDAMREGPKPPAPFPSNAVELAHARSNIYRSLSIQNHGIFRRVSVEATSLTENEPIDRRIALCN